MKQSPERVAAVAAGEKFYFTGEPCKRGHTTKRRVADSSCTVCNVLKATAFAAKKPEHPNRVAARATGETHYSIGKSCVHGHLDKRYVANGFCTSCVLASGKRYHAARPGLMAKAARERRAKNPAPHRLSVKRWASENREAVNVAQRAWRAANLEHSREYSCLYVRQRKIRLYENGGSHTLEDLLALRARQQGRCAACAKRAKLEVDHIVAVIKGGTNNPDNLQLLCRRCNASKGARDATEWLNSPEFARIKQHETPY